MTEIFIDSKKKFLFIIGDWNAKVGNQRIPEVTDKFGLGVQNEAGSTRAGVQKKQTFAKRMTVHSKHPLPTTKEMILHMDITRWSILKSD